MHTFTVYKTETCPYCHAALRFLDALGQERDDIEVRTVDARRDPKAFQELVRQSGRTTVPQILLDGHYLGGWDDLARAAKKGRLDAYLEGRAWEGPKKGLLARLRRK